jgi:hypothetical protein
MRATVRKRALAAVLLFGASLGACSAPPGPAPAPIPARALAPSAAAVIAPRDAGHEGAGRDDAGRDGAGNAEERRIAKMLKKVSTARKLAPKRAVPGKTLTRPELLERVKAHVAREVPPSAIRNEGLAMKLLGLIPTEFDYEAETYALLEAQLAGYYEPADQSMYMAADLDEDNARATLAHELVHALQDQYWDLSARSKYRPGQGDSSATTSALAEGDATSAMFDTLLAGTGKTALDLPEEIFTQQIIQSVSTGPSARAPHAMRAALVAPYVYGTLFVHALRRRGGWNTVNRAWERPPVSTEQILHPEKWEANEPPLTVAAPTFASLGAGFAELDTDTFGELGTRLTFAEWMDESRAEAVAIGWGGDRATLAGRGEEIGLGWRILYDEAKPPRRGKEKSPAEKAFAAIVTGLDARLSRPTKKDASFACFAREKVGPLAIMRAGKSIIVVAGPARAPATGLWVSTGDCVLAEKWSREIAAKTQ